MASPVAPRCGSWGRRRAARNRAPPRISMTRVKRLAVKSLLTGGAALTLLLGACSLAPPLKTPVIPAGDAYKEAKDWTPAQPADRLPRDRWWTLYGNAELDSLQTQLIAANPTLAAAFANYAQARALADQARAGLFPTLGLNAGVQRQRESVNAPLIS